MYAMMDTFKMRFSYQQIHIPHPVVEGIFHLYSGFNHSDLNLAYLCTLHLVSTVQLQECTGIAKLQMGGIVTYSILR